ncbi:pentatricopeptide repeat-containing protein, putative [Ricinus communis]|uniref:Pentatricopeptide repeat-containing protein, putative n=1 Tax=Ricinus communis TaxID=3988 RepID=B9RJS7_RICCO|nr:pentatricopeptide repeat-containing protein, putative [Ricinus communis]|eukprot:XP_002513996.1 pentatricopeptide repeat-containing protein At5g27460 [Ricinus communis]
MNVLFDRSGDIQFKNRSLSTSPKNGYTNSNLKNQIMKLKSPGLNITSILQKWIDNGHKVTVSQLRYINGLLVKSKRYKHALEIFTWMETQKNFRMSVSDYALRLELIIKVNGIEEAEEYFNFIPHDSVTRKAASFALLHGYVKVKDVVKAEALMMKLYNLGLIVNCYPFNEMMKLYMATSQYEKVALVIDQMKRNKIALNLLSYNLWMSSYGEVSKVVKVELVYKEMVNDDNVEVGWSTLATLANIYTKAGIVDKALLALKNAEKILSTSHLLGYFFLMTQYSSLKNKEGVQRLWEACKGVNGRITCANYMCVLSCLVKVGDLLEAEKVFRDWELNCRKYDIRVSNVLLGAYVRKGLMNKAESLHLHTLDRGGCPNYKTLEILMEGWVKSQKMDKAIDAMTQAISMLEHCHWRPSHGIIMSIAEHLERNRNFEDANHFIQVIHHLGVASLPLYKVLLRMHLHAQRAAFDILKMMEKDKIELDDETSALVQAFNLYV